MASNLWKYMVFYDMTQEKMDLYKDFACDLVNEVHKTFLGSDVMGDKECKEHFEWCWNKKIEEFKKEGIYFDHDCNLKQFMWESFNDLYYSYSDDVENYKVRDNMMIMWNFIFDHSKMDKSKGELENTVSVYNKFENCLKNS